MSDRSSWEAADKALEEIKKVDFIEALQGMKEGKIYICCKSGYYFKFIKGVLNFNSCLKNADEWLEANHILNDLLKFEWKEVKE